MKKRVSERERESERVKIKRDAERLSVCAYVCVCECVRETERERKSALQHGSSSISSSNTTGHSKCFSDTRVPVFAPSCNIQKEEEKIPQLFFRVFRTRPKFSVVVSFEI